jgi:hypothetical protein
LPASASVRPSIVRVLMILSNDRVGSASDRRPVDPQRCNRSVHLGDGAKVGRGAQGVNDRPAGSIDRLTGIGAKGG